MLMLNAMSVKMILFPKEITFKEYKSPETEKIDRNPSIDL